MNEIGPIPRLLTAAALGLGLAACTASEGGPSPETPTPAPATTVYEPPTTAPDAGWPGGHEIEPNTSAYREGFVMPKLGKVSLTLGNVCKWKPTSPQPVVTRYGWQTGMEAQVDGRCASAGEDPNVVWARTPKGRAVFSFKTREILEAGCYTEGQPVTDGRGTTSRTHILVHNPAHTGAQINYANQSFALVPAYVTGYALAPNTCVPNQLRLLHESWGEQR